MSSSICFNLDESKILSSGNGLIVIQMIKLILDRVENIDIFFSSHNVFYRSLL